MVHDLILVLISNCIEYLLKASNAKMLILVLELQAQLLIFFHAQEQRSLGPNLKSVSYQACSFSVRDKSMNVCSKP
jgi:hypothetical protein